MIGVPSILEVVDQDNNILKQRNEILAQVTGIGPTDTCIVVKEHLPTGLNKLLKKSYTRTYAHFIYGVDTSSLSSIAAYFRHFLDMIINKTQNCRVQSGCFCTYDLFSKLDLRVEIKIPGKTFAYLTDSAGNVYKAEEIHWQGCYLSSGLRAFYPIRGTAVNFIELFKSTNDIEQYFQVAMKFWNKLGFVLGDVKDTNKYAVNLLVPAISKYLLNRKRYKLHQVLFKNYIEKDPLMLTFLADSSLKVGKMDEIQLLVKNQIKMTPHCFPLYYSAAKAHLKRGETVQAIKICQFLVELNLEVYNYWDLLIKCLIKNKEYSSALICFNYIPHYVITKADQNLNYSEKQLNLPDKISFAAVGNVWIAPTELDFRPFEGMNLKKSSTEKDLLQKIKNLPAAALSGSKEKAYKLLVKIEKRIEWESMIRIKQSVLKKTNNVHEEQKVATQILSSIGGDGKSGFTRTVFQTFSHDFTPENDPYIEDYQPAQLLTYRNYFLQDHSINKLSLMMSPVNRIQNEETSHLYNCLYTDLKTIYEWQKESSDIQAVHALKNSNK